MNELKSLLRFGNKKLPKTTAIFNMNSAHDCPSRKLGLCELEDECYAFHPEIMFPNVLPFRRRQEKYWDATSAEKFAEEFLDAIKYKRIHRVNQLRFSEAGDFKSQSDVDKMDKIAMYLSYYSITTYVYTARRDLDFSKVRHVTTLASGFTGCDSMFIGVKDALHYHREAKKLGIKSFVCPGNCKICNACPVAKTKKTIIYCEIH